VNPKGNALVLGEQKIFSYYPGCTLKSSAREYDISARLSCKALGVELEELENWACCGASSAHSSNDLLAISLPARDLRTAGEKGHPLVAACAMCFSRLKIASHDLQNESTRKLVGEIIGHEVQQATPVFHLLEVIDSRLEPIEVKKPLTGLKVACYYGCLLTRPPEVTHFDDAEYPQSMDRLLSALGASVLDWGYRTDCCGASFSLTRTDIVRKLSHDILEGAREVGAEAIATACPLCQLNLDSRQREIEAEYGTRYNLPVFYFTQLMGLAFGIAPRALGLERSIVSPERVLVSRT